jgi:hypothetical protein
LRKISNQLVSGVIKVKRIEKDQQAIGEWRHQDQQATKLCE